MESQLQPGLKGQIQRVVQERDSTQHVGGGSVLVLASPVMIGLMETAAMEAVRPLLPAGQETVGVHVDVRHLAPTPVGMNVIVHAELLKVEGRMLTFRVTAKDDKEQIGEGTHVRAIIDGARFQSRVQAKAAGK